MHNPIHSCIVFIRGKEIEAQTSNPRSQPAREQSNEKEITKMAQLPTIREIALNLYVEADLDYTTSDTRGDGFSDDYEGYVNCLVSRNVIEYHKDGLTLSIAEVIGSVPDEDGGETKEWHTLDYLYSIEDSESSFEEDGTGSADELVKVIKDFMA